MSKSDELEEPDEVEAAGGDPACWAGLVCPDCGSVLSEGHRDGCPSAAPAAGGELFRRMDAGGGGTIR